MRWSLAALVLSGYVTLLVGCNPAETPPPPPKVTLPITAPVESVPAPKTPAGDSKAPVATPPVATPAPAVTDLFFGQARHASDTRFHADHQSHARRDCSDESACLSR